MSFTPIMVDIREGVVFAWGCAIDGRLGLESLSASTPPCLVSPTPLDEVAPLSSLLPSFLSFFVSSASG